MKSLPVQLSDVVYNAGTQAFEALVTVHKSGRAISYACAIDAPISMTFADAAQGLTRQALRRHHGAAGAAFMPQSTRQAAATRAPRRRTLRRDPFAMLRAALAA